MSSYNARFYTRSEAEHIPLSQPEMALASFTQVFKSLCYITVVVILVWGAYYAQTKLSSAEWNVNFAEADATNTQFIQYEKDKAAYNNTIAQVKKVPRFDYITAALALTTMDDITAENIRVQTTADNNNAKTVRQSFIITGYSKNNDLDYVRSYIKLLEDHLHKKLPDAQISINLKDASSANRTVAQKQLSVLSFNINGEIKL